MMLYTHRQRDYEKFYCLHSETLGKSRIGSQGAKNGLKESNEGQVGWSFMVITEWGWGEDLGLGGLNLPLMLKQEAPCFSYKLAQIWGRKRKGSGL